jgi:redox-sensitive bicupin YhaK (pirin superfamily)
MSVRDDSRIDLVIEGRSRDIGGFPVRRILPYAKRRMVGPFIFLDEMGPLVLPEGQGLDVAPHPHIGLSTLTYLFEGEIMHRDSLGSEQAIRPGAVNWMTAGRGIVHSERSSEEERAREKSLHGLQSWIALPLEQEEAEPDFSHHAACDLPVIEREGALLRLLAGEAYGEVSPVPVFSELFYLHAELHAGAEVDLPEDHEERAVYVVQGEVELTGATVTAGQLAVLRPGGEAEVRAVHASRVMLLGGARLKNPRHIWWNFVSSKPERLEKAKSAWKARDFPPVPGDDGYVPLPED